MPLDTGAFEKAATIQREFEEHFASLPSVVGVGLGLNSAADGPAINVQVTQKLAPTTLPKRFHGLEVVVDVVGRITAYKAK
jgi:hypothetical protein